MDEQRAGSRVLIEYAARLRASGQSEEEVEAELTDFGISQADARALLNSLGRFWESSSAVRHRLPAAGAGMQR